MGGREGRREGAARRQNSFDMLHRAARRRRARPQRRRQEEACQRREGMVCFFVFSSLHALFLDSRLVCVWIFFSYAANNE